MTINDRTPLANLPSAETAMSGKRRISVSIPGSSYLPDRWGMLMASGVAVLIATGHAAGQAAWQLVAVAVAAMMRDAFRALGDRGL